MNNKILKILGLVFTVGAAGFSIGNSIVTEKKTEKKLEELVDKKWAEEKENEEES